MREAPLPRPPSSARLAGPLLGALLALWPLGAPAQDGPLTGHGGPVMGVAVSPEGRVATASFDNSVGLWGEGGPRWLEGHVAAVVAVAFVPDGRLVSGGDDFEVRLWDPATRGSSVIGRHEGKVADLAVSGDLVASAGWDGAIGLWPLGGSPGRTLTGHDGAVAAVAFLGRALVSGSADGTGRVWDVETGAETRRLVSGGFGIGALATGPGWLAYGAADGTARVLDAATGDTLADPSVPGAPLLALAVSPHGARLAIGGGDGRVIVVDTARWEVIRSFQGAAQGPVWALAFAGDRLLGGGIDPRVPVWAVDAPAEPLAAGAEAPPAASNGERQFRAKCSICHTLTSEGERRAAPPLGGVIGRPAAAVAGYPYSEALARSGIVWDGASIDALFERGPDVCVPGTIMPTQRIAGADDRRDLIDYPARAGEPTADGGGGTE